MVFAFGDFELDPATRELRRGRRRIELQPNAFDLLVHLVRNRDRVLAKDELFDAVWKEVVVSESSLSFAIKLIRKALGDTGAKRRFIETVHGRGFRFIGECTEVSACGGRLDERTDSTVGVPAPGPSEGQASEVGAPPVGRFAEPGTPLVGRLDELGTLCRLLDEVLACKETRFALIAGEPGIGKTRLASEMLSRAVARGATALLGTCDEDAPPAFWPWVQIVDGLVRNLPGAGLQKILGAEAADLARLVPALSEHRYAPTPATDDDREIRSVRLHHALCGLVSRAAALGPVVLVLDDLQWADASSLLTLRLLLSQSPKAPLFVIGTLRDTEIAEGQPLSRFLTLLRRERVGVSLPLAGLSDEESSQLLLHISRERPDADLARTLTRLVEGNPFFLEEVYRHLHESGALDASAADPLSIARRGGGAPGVREILGQRLRRLGDACVGALTVAAVAGFEFSFRSVASAARIEPEALLALLDEALAQRVVEETDARNGRYRFRHALIREVLYAGVSGARRAELHRRVGEALEGAAAVEGSAETAAGLIEELAYHFALAENEPDKAARYAVAAGRAAEERYAFEEAGDWFVRAGGILAKDLPEDLDRRYSAAMMAGDAYRVAADDVRERASYLEAAFAARALDDPHRFVTAATAAFPRRTISPSQMIDLHEEAVRVARGATEAVPAGLRARALSRLATSLYNVPGSLARREALCREAIELLDEASDPRERAATLENLQFALWRAENAAWRVQLADELERVATRHGLGNRRLSAMFWRIAAQVELGRWRVASAEIEGFVAAAQAARLPSYVGYATMFRATRAMVEAHLEDAERLTADSIAHGAGIEDPANLLRYSMAMAYLRGLQGRLEEALPSLRLFFDRTPGPWDAILAEIHAQIGDLSACAHHFDRAIADDFARLRAVEGHYLWPRCLHALAVAGWRLSRRDSASWLYERLLPFADHWLVAGPATTCVGSGHLALGFAAAAGGRRKDATAHLERSLAAHESEGATLPALVSRLELGRLLLASADRRSRQRGVLHLRRARSDARATQCAHLEAQIGALLAGG